jgi:hypothetical protein
MIGDSIRPSRRVKGASLVMSLVIACAVAYSAGPAFATDQSYECGSCNEVSGSNNYIRNVFGQNKSGGGNCTFMWKSNGGGNYSVYDESCQGGTAQSVICPGAEIYGHGTTRNSPVGGHLWGNESNYKECV